MDVKLQEEVIGLLDGVRDGTFEVLSYRSEWIQPMCRGNKREMTILIKDTRFTEKGKKIGGSQSKLDNFEEETCACIE